MKRFCANIAAAMLFLFSLPPAVQAADYLIPGGQVIGLQLENDTVSIAAFDDVLGTQAREAGLQIGDELLTINGAPIHSAGDVRTALSQPGEKIILTVRRNGKKHSLYLIPEVTAEGRRLGIYLRQGIAGVGTVTWQDPGTRLFGTLGHGVSDSRGRLLDMTRGSIFPARIQAVKKGTCGDPGQLKGTADNRQLWGTLTRNTSQGVFGILTDILPGEPIPVADYEDLSTGSATIRCTVDSGPVQEYSVEILKIYAEDRSDGRNLLLKITDPTLLSKTGGIVQGMSGAPIVQNGKLVGAVTHVLVNDPTRGYGIFIENMLEAAE